MTTVTAIITLDWSVFIVLGDSWRDRVGTQVRQNRVLKRLRYFETTAKFDV